MSQGLYLLFAAHVQNTKVEGEGKKKEKGKEIPQYHTVPLLKLAPFR